MEVTVLKKVLAIVCLMVVLTMAVAMVASAATATTQDNWRLWIACTDTAGLNGTGNTTLGVGAGLTDGFGVDGTASDTGSDVVYSAGTQQPQQRGVFSVSGGRAWKTDMKSNRLPKDPAYNAGVVRDVSPEVKYGAYPYEANRKIWDLRVVGLGSADTKDTVLTIRFVSIAAGVPKNEIPVYGSDPVVLKPAKYALRMVDNRGIALAPGNGTVWSIPVPATWQTAVFLSVTLPTFNITATSPKDEALILSQGYKMQFYQTPEPSSLMALGAGLMGLGGFFSRRRRS